MKSGMIGETIVNLIFTYDKIPLPNNNTAVARIDVFLRDGFIDSGLCDILYALHKIRNKAAHENYASVNEGKVLLQMAYSLCEWFMQTYGADRRKKKAIQVAGNRQKSEVETRYLIDEQLRKVGWEAD